MGGSFGFRNNFIVKIVSYVSTWIYIFHKNSFLVVRVSSQYYGVI